MKRALFAGASLLFAAIWLVCLGRAQSPPAPTTDRVGFPEEYQKLNVLYVFDRPDNKQVRTVYANDLAFSIKNGQQFAYPYGSILVMETWASLKDHEGNPVLDGNGRYQKDRAATPTLFVMRKERGFGEAYQQNRTGEWEYVAYRPDRSYQTTPQNSFSCAVCHLQAGQGKDWVFRAALHFNGGSGAVADAVMKNYKFVPGVLTVASGSFVTFYNDDVVEHTITDDTPGLWGSDRLRGGRSLTFHFGDGPGEFHFHCSIHPSMKGIVVVLPPR